MKTIVACLTHNHWNVTRHYLDSIETLQDKSIKELIFIDNCSTDGTVENLQALGKKVIQNPVNSVSSAINIMFDYDKECNVLFVANDHVIPNGLVDDLNYYAEKHDLGLISPFTFISSHELLDKDRVYNWEFYYEFCAKKTEMFVDRERYEDGLELLSIFFPKGIDQANTEFKERHKDDEDCFYGWWPGLVLQTRKAIEEVGRYDENYIGAGYEDFDYLRRCRDAGVKLAVTNRCFAFHFGSMTTRKFVGDKEMSKVEALNGEYYHKKWNIQK